MGRNGIKHNRMYVDGQLKTVDQITNDVHLAFYLEGKVNTALWS